MGAQWSVQLLVYPVLSLLYQFHSLSDIINKSLFFSHPFAALPFPKPLFLEGRAIPKTVLIAWVSTFADLYLLKSIKSL